MNSNYNETIPENSEPPVNFEVVDNHIHQLTSETSNFILLAIVRLVDEHTQHLIEKEAKK